jgi:predicted Zn-dependent peptidase
MYKKITLKNNLRLVLAPMKSTNTVTVLVVVGTGSRHESVKLNGMSHFLEHMFFKGTKKRKDTLSISTELDKIGANYNAFTGKEVTGFYVKTDAKHLDLSLDVLSDILLNSKFDLKEINRERGVILEEMKMVQDMPMHYVGDLFESLLYGKSSLGQLIVGTKKNILNFKQKDFLDYLNDRYRSKNIVVCVAGKEGQINKSRAKIEKFFNKTKKGKAKDQDIVEFKNKQTKPQILVHNKETDQAHICLGVRSYGLKDKRKTALKLLSIVLGGNMSSRLFTEIREKRGLAYYVRSTQDSYVDEGYLVTQAGVDKNKIEESIKIILKEYKKIAQQGIKNEELQKAKEYIKGISSIGLETSDQVASFLTNQEILLGEILTLKENFRKIDKVTVKDIQSIAKDIFVDSKLNLAIIGNYKSDKKFKKILKF